VSWPKVAGEFDTIRAVAAGASISRFGDGEMKIIYGAGYVREPPNPALSAELLEVFRNRQAGVLVGIPTLDPAGPKYENWLRHQERFERLLASSRGPYFSAFITRPDSAPWILTAEYLDLTLSCWRGRRVALVCEPDSKMHGVVGAAAAQVVHIRCPSRESYQQISLLEIAVRRAEADVAVLSCGPTATCLAARLCRRGIQAIDIGSAGGFLARLLAADS
jgi:hypothetical protein